jgi:hypothetical protein
MARCKDFGGRVEGHWSYWAFMMMRKLSHAKAIGMANPIKAFNVKNGIIFLIISWRCFFSG